MRRSLVVGNLSPCRSDLPVAIFTGCSLNKQRVPHPVNPEHPENPDSANKQALSPDNVAGLRREVAAAFRRCSASRKRGNVPKFAHPLTN